MSEFAPKGTNPKMTKAQVRAYIANMQNAKAIAKEKLEIAKKSGDYEKELKELEDLEEKLKNL